MSLPSASPPLFSSLPPEAELHYTRGLLHLRRGEAIMPYAMAVREEKAPPGTDMLFALLGLATVATSRALGQTRWIEQYRGEMRTALTHFEKSLDLAPQFADIYFRRASAFRHLGDAPNALQSAREAVRLSPENRDYAAFLRILEGAASPIAPPPLLSGLGARRSTGAVNVSAQKGNVANATNPGPLTWDDVILPAKTKRELRQMQLVLENPSQARALGVEPPTGLLLYGPPGTGKTTVARVLAAQAKCKFIATSAAEINNMWVGESEKNVQKLFDEARKAGPSIIFLDEVDALIPNRAGGMHQYSDKVVNQFLHEMDGLKPNQGVFVIGATNRPDMLDPALVRGGRLSRQIEIPLPDETARLAMLALHTRSAQMDETVNVATLARETDGFSGGDLRALVNEAGLQALIRLADEGGTPALTHEDFVVATENLRRPE